MAICISEGHITSHRGELHSVGCNKSPSKLSDSAEPQSPVCSSLVILAIGGVACLHRCSPNTRSRSRFRLYLRSASIEYSDFEPMRKQVETWQRSELTDYYRQGRHLRGVCGEPTILARIERGDCCCYFCARVECASASARRKASKSAQIRDVVLPSRVLMTGSALFDE